MERGVNAGCCCGGVGYAVSVGFTHSLTLVVIKMCARKSLILKPFYYYYTTTLRNRFR